MVLCFFIQHTDCTPLHVAADITVGSIHIVKLLLRNNANPHATDDVSINECNDTKTRQ